MTSLAIDVESPILNKFATMTINMNGWATTEYDDSNDRRYARWQHLRDAAKRHKTTVLGVQEHHFHSHQEAAGYVNKFTHTQWGFIYNLSLQSKSGVAILYRKNKWSLVNTYSLDPRILVAILNDVDNRPWRIISAHFHNRPHEQKRQWDKISKELDTNMPTIILADHNSVLDPLLDVDKPSNESRNIVKQREHEISVYHHCNLVDAWTVVHSPQDGVDDQDFRIGMTRNGRRIDRCSVTLDIHRGIAGSYITNIGGSDHRAVITHFAPAEGEIGDRRWTLPKVLKNNKKFHDDIANMLRDTPGDEGGGGVFYPGGEILKKGVWEI